MANYKGMKHTIESRKKMSIIHKGKSLSNEHKKKIGLANKGKIKPKFTIEHRKKIGIKSAGRKPMLGKKHSEETKIKIGNSTRGLFSGEKNPNWNGGTTKYNYPAQFKKIRKEILIRDNYTCKFCRFYSIEKKQKNTNYMTVHHIDFDKKNNDPKNLTVLCNKCNSSINHKRW